MKIERIRNRYRIRKTYKGKTYTVMFDHKPTQKEALIRMTEKLDGIVGHNMTFETAAFDYIESKSSILSPSTYREYKNNVKRYSKAFRKMNIYDISLKEVQAEVNRFAQTRAPKTVRNYNAFISSVIAFYRPGVSFPVSLPQKVKKEPYIPTDEDIKKVLHEAEGTEFEIPIRLACYGLRRSEICALTLDDLTGNVLSINKALVLDINKEWVIKTTKTEDSTREVYIDDALVKLATEKGYFYNGHPGNITDWLSRTEKALGIPHFSIHKLRHYYASMAHSLGVPDAYIIKAGGWKTDHVMKSVYRHALKDKAMENMEKVAAHISGLKA